MYTKLTPEQFLFLLVMATQPQERYFTADEIDAKADHALLGDASEKCVEYKLCARAVDGKGRTHPGKIRITAEGESAIPRQHRNALESLGARIGGKTARAKTHMERNDPAAANQCEMQIEILQKMRRTIDTLYAEFQRQGSLNARPASEPIVLSDGQRQRVVRPGAPKPKAAASDEGKQVTGRTTVFAKRSLATG